MARKKKVRRDPTRSIVSAAVALTLLMGAFGLGWYFGVQST